jgi:hypothetical protein
MIPVHRVMPRALAAVLRQAPLSADKVAFAWRTAVGPAVDQATTVRLEGDVLVVDARDATWRREVERSAPLVHARLAALLGEDTIRTIRVRDGGSPARHRPGRP